MAARHLPDSWVLSRPSLFGLESEYQITFLDGSGETLPRERCAGAMVLGVSRQIVNLPGRDEFDLFLSNGARFYRDSCVGLCNLEYATPECSSPDELVAHVRAGDAIVADAVRDYVASSNEVHSAIVSRCNFDYHGHTNGSHENHLHTMSSSKLAPQLVPLLASRAIVSGGGGFDDAMPGLEFMCSPRVRHLEFVVSRGAQDSRAIFTVKDESLAGPGYHRLKLLSSESVHCEASERLRFAPVELVLRMVAAGHRPGEPMRLADPLAAINTFARDPTGTVTSKLSAGRQVTALDVQRHYLAAVESCLSEDWMPEWAETECGRWRWVLDTLADSPQHLIGHLDWPTKQHLYRAYSEQLGIAWSTLPRWNHALRELSSPSKSDSEDEVGVEHTTPCIESLLKARGNKRRQVIAALDRHDLLLSDLPNFVELRNKLFEADIRFGEVGKDSLFDRLQREELIAPDTISCAKVESARTDAPSGTRARVRAKWIGHLHAKHSRHRGSSSAAIDNPLVVPRARRRGVRTGGIGGWHTKIQCSWDHIVDHDRELVLKLRDPFQSTSGRWSKDQAPRPLSPMSLNLTLAPIARALAARRPRQALGRVRALLRDADSVPRYALRYCIHVIRGFVPQVPVPVLRRGGATAGMVLKDMFDSELCRGNYALMEQIGQLLYRFYEARGQYDRAAMVVERLLSRATDVGDSRGIATYGNNLGYEHLLAGRYISAERFFEKAIERFEQLREHSDFVNAHANLLECRFSSLPATQWVTLLPRLKKANRLLMVNNDWRARKTLRLLARYAQHRGRIQAARGWMRRAISVAADQPTQLRDLDKAYLKELETPAVMQRSGPDQTLVLT